MPDKSLYLAGPMSGVPKFNYPLFESAADHLRSLGYSIVSPAELDDAEVYAYGMQSTTGNLEEQTAATGQSWGDFLARDLKLLVDKCDGIVLLNKWERSKGARQELFTALNLGYSKFGRYDEVLGIVWLEPFALANKLNDAVKSLHVKFWE